MYYLIKHNFKSILLVLSCYDYNITYYKNYIPSIGIALIYIYQ